MSIKPIILAGGAGSRLWPASRQLMPKQFLRLFGAGSMLAETLSRLDGLGCSEPYVICNDEHRFLAAEEMRAARQEDAQIILEPVGKNTAPAIALAAFLADPEDELLVLAADHVIGDREAFQLAVKTAAAFSGQNKLVTFGVVPASAHTGYGYIKASTIHEASAIEKFVEKPIKEVAESYLASGEYFWNSGMFMFKASVYLDELKKYAPEVYSACEKAVSKAESDMNFIRPNAEEFSKTLDISVDYAVMENTDNAIVVPMDAQWSDVGSWASIWELSPKDENDNVANGDVISIGSKSCYIDAGEKLVAAVGVENLVIVQTKDALLVADIEKIQEIQLYLKTS